MRFAYLGSGSGGNAALVCEANTRLLIDCGFTRTQTEFRLRRLGVEPDMLSGILVTHEHADHISGVAAMARRYNLPVWMTAGTYAGWRDSDVSILNTISPHEAFVVEDIEVQPYPVPHDAREPCQYVLANGDKRLGVLSDAGRVTAHMVETLHRCDALLLECNHDPAMLASGPYPQALKRRVGGDLGHLSNFQAAGLLASLDNSCLQHLVIAHISEKNNTPTLARAAVAEVLACELDWIAVADQHAGLDWRELRAA